MHKSKIDSSGKYLPFYGYTCASFLGPSAADLTKKIERFVKTSSLRKYFSALPGESFHMTLFNIFCMAGPPIPPVAKWLQENNEQLPDSLWLPEDVLKVQNTNAVIATRKLPRQVTIKDIRLYFERGLGVWVEIEEENKLQIANLRKKLADLYQHDDKNLHPHITFAYRFKPDPDTDQQKQELKEDLERLQELAEQAVGLTLERHNIYLYSSMELYRPLEFFYSSSLNQ